MRRNVICVDRLAVQGFGEAQQQLRQLDLGLELVRTRTVVPLFQATEFYLQTQILQVQIVGALLLHCGPLRLCFGALLLLSTLQQQRVHHRLQCFLIFR